VFHKNKNNMFTIQVIKIYLISNRKVSFLKQIFEALNRLYYRDYSKREILNKPILKN